MLTATEAHEIANNVYKYKIVKEHLEKICSVIKEVAKQGRYDLVIWIEWKIEKELIDEIEKLGYSVFPIGHENNLNYKGNKFYRIHW